MAKPDTTTDRTEAQGLEADLRAHLGEQLRRVYGSVLSEPVPNRLTALLDELERRERAARGATSEGAER